ncbi:MAG: T9SS type A sorting domain-containing protein, partial [Saprospiraceae bacterium]|nr:T9SS type A sorting domain-containing protein [Saprospiraceae bacterium]
APVGSTVSGNLQPGLEATIYPNPASELIWINLDNDVERAQVSVTNLLGQRLMQRNIISSSQMMIPVRELGVEQQVVLIHINIPGQRSIVKKVLIVK